MPEWSPHSLVSRVFDAAAEEPSVDFQRRVLEAVNNRGQAGTRKERRGPQRNWHGFRPRSVMIAVAACLVTALGASAVFAETSGAIDVLSAMGLKNVVVHSVRGSASDAGLTLQAHSAYRDRYLLAIGMNVDGAGDDRVLFGPRGGIDDPRFTATLSSGQRLQMVGGGLVVDDPHNPGQLPLGSGRASAETLVLAAPDTSELAGDELTIVVHSMTREQRCPDPDCSGGRGILPGYGGPGREKTIEGTWTIKLHVPVEGSGVKDLPAPPAEQVGGLRVAFHDIRSNGTFLSVRQDVTEVTPGALNKPWECARLRSPSSSQGVPADACDKPQPLTLGVYDSNGNEVKAILQKDDLPFAKGGPGPYDPSRTYHWTYGYILPGPGTYKMVMPGEWPTVTNGRRPYESDLIAPHYVQTLTIR